jgi:hypothetical protein
MNRYSLALFIFLFSTAALYAAEPAAKLVTTAATESATAKQAADNVVPFPTIAAQITETYGFTLDHYGLAYQGQQQVIDLDVSYIYRQGLALADYPDVVVVKKTIEEYLHNYPDKNRYWELLNKDIVQLLISKYSAFANVTSKLYIYPSPHETFARTTVVTAKRIIAP